MEFKCNVKINIWVDAFEKYYVMFFNNSTNHTVIEISKEKAEELSEKFNLEITEIPF